MSTPLLPSTVSGRELYALLPLVYLRVALINGCPF